MAQTQNVGATAAVAFPEWRSTHDGRRKDAFVATLTHEFHQPLTAMVLAVETVRVAPGTRKARGVANVMRQQLNEMSRLIEQLVDTGEPVPVWDDGDRQQLFQVIILNLLRNALKYTEPGGRITMVVERWASNITVRVGDTGRGTETEALPRVFDLFSQIRPQEAAGLGIGLGVVREIVLQHGGSIEARSVGACKGNEFIVRLPLAAMTESLGITMSPTAH